MKRKFKVTIEGRNLLLKIEEQVSKHGVFIVRFVEAIDEILAEHTALEDFRSESKGKALMESLLNTSDDPPIFEANEIVEIDSFENYSLNLGLIFYPETEED